MIGQIYFSIYKKVTFGDSVHFIKSPAASALSDNKASFTKYMSSENIYRIIPNWTVIPRWELRVIELSLHMDEGQKKSDSLHPLNPWPGSNECGSEERGGEEKDAKRELHHNFLPPWSMTSWRQSHIPAAETKKWQWGTEILCQKTGAAMCT